MNSIKFSHVVIAAVVIAAGMCAPETNAQMTWGNGYSSSFSERNPQGNDSIELIPYGRDSDYETGRSPNGYGFNRSLRSLNPTESHDHSAGCGHSSACNHEHNHADERSNANPQLRRRSYYNEKLYANARKYANEQTFATQDPRRPELDQRNPADQRPQLKAPVLLAPRPKFSYNNSGRQFGDLRLLPPTSPRLLPAPKLTPLPPTDPHAGHSH